MKQIKIDAAQIKNILQKIAFLKNYSSLVVSGIITLAAIMILLFVQFFLGSKLKANIEKNSVNLGKNVKGLVDTAVSTEQAVEEKKYQDAYGEDANNITLLTMQCTERELLSYKVFPEPETKSGLVFEEFGKNYCNGMDAIIKKCKGGYPLTEEEIGEIVSRTQKTAFEGTGGGGTEVTDTIRNELCLQRANSISFYVNPSSLGGYNFWKDFKFEDWQKALKECWRWQLGYWVIEDVIDTAGKMSLNSGNVMTSPVKRIVSVTFIGESSSGDTNSVSTEPIYIVAAGDKPQDTFTGRYTNEDIDVLRFNVVVLVDWKSMLAFTKELCSAKTHTFRGFSGKEAPVTFKHNQITILSSRVNLLDKQSGDNILCRYGDNPVLELKLTCEYVFNKNVYAQIKPVFSEGEMSGTAPESGGATGGGGQGGGRTGSPEGRYDKGGGAANWE